jgi:hypothetical protein
MDDTRDLGVGGPCRTRSFSSTPPDGGYGWVCVLAQFIVNGFTWGVAAVRLYSPVMY